MKLRPYQEECSRCVLEQFQTHWSTLVSMATGTGKTVLFAHLARGWREGRVLVVAHRDELIRQAADKVQAILGEPPGIEMGEDRADESCAYGKSKVLVTSVQTMSRPKRQEKFRPEEFGLLIIDEAHHSVGASYRSVIDYFRQNDCLKLLGVTATPKRADELALGQIFESVACDYGIEAAVADGWLVPIQQQAVVVEGLDFSKVHTIGGDFNESELEKILTEETALHKVAAPTIEIAGDRPSLVFCVSVRHASMTADILNRYKPGSAKCLHGESPKDERREWVDRFKAGKVQFMVNVGLFLEGFDAPNTVLVVFARPTKSIVLYSQVLGRGTRPLPGVVDGIESPDERIAAIKASAKPFMVVLDFVGNSGKHRIITAADLLGGKYGVPVRQHARENAERGGRSADVNESLERAAAEVGLLEEERERRRRIKAEAEYRTREVSPFAGNGVATEAHFGARGQLATEKQIAFLVRLGVQEATAASYGRRQASAVIDKLLSRRKQRA